MSWTTASNANRTQHGSSSRALYLLRDWMTPNLVLVLVVIIVLGSGSGVV